MAFGVRSETVTASACQDETATVFVCRHALESRNALESRKESDDRKAFDDRKTLEFGERERGPNIERQNDGSVRIGGFALASQFLRGGGTRQAGFNAALVARFPQKNVSILFQEGETHRRQRAAVARFFAPVTVATRYRQIMSTLSIELVERLKQKRSLALDELSSDLSIGIAAEIVGMTNSLRPGLGARLSRFFETDADAAPSQGWLQATREILRTQFNLVCVYALDVLPAILARRRSPREDLISHLLQQKWSHFNILTECVTYGTAGMSTTREFIVAAAWHLLERDTLRARFLQGDEDGRLAILGEILRLEPAVSTLYRMTVDPVTLEHNGKIERIPANTVVSIDIRGVNTDVAAAGACPYRLDPDRTVRGAVGLMSFGDGPHRCPGASVALQETAIFLDHLLRVPGLQLVREPDVSRNHLSTGYVLRNAILTVD